MPDDLDEIIDPIAVPDEQVTEPEVTAEPVAEVAEDAPAEPAPVEEPAKQPEPTVPLSALLEVRREMQELKGRIPQQEAPPPPDVLDDPQGFAGHVSGQVAQAVTQVKLEQSRFNAEREFGKDLVDEAYAYFDANPAQSHQFLSHPSPFHAAVDFYQRQKTAQEVGSDPEAYRAKIEAEVRAKIESEQAAKQAATAAPSLAASPNLGARNSSVAPTHTPLDDLLS